MLGVPEGGVTPILQKRKLSPRDEVTPLEWDLHQSLAPELMLSSPSPTLPTSLLVMLFPPSPSNPLPGVSLAPEVTASELVKMLVLSPLEIGFPGSGSSPDPGFLTFSQVTLTPTWRSLRNTGSSQGKRPWGLEKCPGVQGRPG